MIGTEAQSGILGPLQISSEKLGFFKSELISACLYFLNKRNTPLLIWVEDQDSN